MIACVCVFFFCAAELCAALMCMPFKYLPYLCLSFFPSNKYKKKGPTVVPQYLQERYSNTFYGSGDLQKECLVSYDDCCTQLEGLIGFQAAKAQGGEIVIMSGEGMVGLWGGLKSVIPWPFQYSKETTADGGVVTKLVEVEGRERKFRVLTVGNGVYGCGMLDMIVGMRYPNLEVRAVDSAWDRPVDVEKAVEAIADWKPDLVTSKYPFFSC